MKRLIVNADDFGRSPSVKKAQHSEPQSNSNNPSGVSVAIGYVPKEIADEMEGWGVEILGEILPARLQPLSLFDANGSRMRS